MTTEDTTTEETAETNESESFDQPNDDLFEQMYEEEVEAVGSASEEDDQEAAADAEHEATTQEVAAEPAPKNKTEERVVRRLQQAEAALQERDDEIARLRSAQTATRPAFKSSGDMVEDVISLIQNELNTTDANDPRIKERLMRLGGDLVAQLHDDPNDPGIRARNEQRAQAKRERDIQAQIDELKAGNTQKDLQLRDQQAIQYIGQTLTQVKAEDRYPHLFAVESDVPEVINQGLKVLYAKGHRVTAANAVDTLEYICKQIDDEHRKVAERLEAVKSKKAAANGQKAAVQPNQTQTETRGARKDGQSSRREDRGRTVTASGVGGRQAPQPQKTETSDEMFDRMYREELAEANRQVKR